MPLNAWLLSFPSMNMVIYSFNVWSFSEVHLFHNFELSVLYIVFVCGFDLTFRMQDVAELLGMMVEDYKRLQPNVETYAYDFLSQLIQILSIINLLHGQLWYLPFHEGLFIMPRRLIYNAKNSYPISLFNV